MNDILKQRLVGAVVLVALGVVFWPIVFVQSDRPSLDQTSQVVPMPQLEEVDIPAPQPLAGVESVSQADKLDDYTDASEPVAMVGAGQDTMPSDTDVTPPAEEEGVADTRPAAGSGTTPAPRSPNLDEQGIPVAWVLQVASVRTRERAEELTAELLAANHKAYHRRVRIDAGDRYRVFIGPVFEREKLEGVKREVDTQLGVDALIARYVP